MEKVRELWESTDSWHPALRFGSLAGVILFALILLVAVPELVVLGLIILGVVAYRNRSRPESTSAPPASSTDRGVPPDESSTSSQAPPPPASPSIPAEPSSASPSTPAPDGHGRRTFTSTIMGGNAVFKRHRITLDDRLVRVERPKFLGRGEEDRVGYGNIASVRVKKGLVWGSVVIETMGGAANDFEISGLTKRDAKEVQRLLYERIE